MVAVAPAALPQRKKKAARARAGPLPRSSTPDLFRRLHPAPPVAMPAVGGTVTPFGPRPPPSIRFHSEWPEQLTHLCEYGNPR